MISKFLREQRRYSQNDLCNIFECSDDQLLPIIRKLKEFNILKPISYSDKEKDISDIVNTNIDVPEAELDSNNVLYVFTFVGVIIVAERVLKCYPKYLPDNLEPNNELKLILRVLEKYNSKEQIINLFSETEENQTFNLLSLLLFIIRDFFENGVYSNEIKIVENNGCGEIFWDKTINDTFAIISNNRPYYIDIHTQKTILDDNSFFKRLHETIITKASKELMEAGLLDLFGITSVDLSNEELEDLGDKEYILNKIENELNIQFNTRKQTVLKALYAYIEREESLSNVNALSLFGTNSFNLVWEDVCKVILDNKLNQTLGSIKLPVDLRKEYNPKSKLIDIIEKPYWSITGLASYDTLIPDVISIERVDNDYEFLIFDAKYYAPKLEPGFVPNAIPGIESVAKQYLYQLAYKKFFEDHSFKSLINCFLMPTDKSYIVNKGYVSLKILDNLNLQKIQVRMIPASLAFNLYLSGKKLCIKDLQL